MENAVALFGSFDSNIKLIEREFGVRITCRGSELKVEGEAAFAAKATTVIESLLQFISRGEALSEQNVRYCISLVNAGSEDKIEQLAGDCICITSKGKPIKPKTIGQKRYCDLIAKNTITIGVGPAGTGKTYLAVAMAVTAFRSKQVNRIILTRPAVEAGEKLGFLPGDLQSKCSARRPTKNMWNAATLRWRRSPTCAAARSTTALSFSTRRKTPRASR